VFSCVLTECLQIVTDTSSGCTSGFLDSGIESSFLRSWQVMFEACRLFISLIGRVISGNFAELRQFQYEATFGQHSCLAATEI